jgi:hypothetical protein
MSYDMTSVTPKTFWQRKEGVTGMIFLPVVAAFVVWLGIKAVPLVILAMTNIITMVLLGIVLLVLGVVLTDKKTWLILGALYAVIMKGITGAVIKLDPIAIMKDHLKKLRKNIKVMDESLDNLSGEEKTFLGKIQRNQSEMEEHISRARAAKERVDAGQGKYASVMELESRKAQRKKDSNDKLRALLDKIVVLREILEKMAEKAKLVYEDTEDDIKTKEEMRKIMASGYSAFKSAQSVIQGDPDEVEFFNAAMEQDAADFGAKVGEIDRWMRNSGSLLTSMDLDNEVKIEKGLKLIEEYTAIGNTLDLQSTRQISSKQPVYVSETTAAPANKYY